MCENFRENRQKIAVFAKIKIYQTFKIFPFCRAHLLLYRGAKNKRNQTLSQKSAKNILSSNSRFNGLFVSHVADNCYLFCNNLKKKSTFVNFALSYNYFASNFRENLKVFSRKVDENEIFVSTLVRPHET